MKIVVNVDFETDGDYSILKAKELEMTVGFEDYSAVKIFCLENNPTPKKTGWEEDSWIKYQAKNFLEEILCNIHVSGSHYYLIKDFYEMFDDGIKFISNYSEGDGHIFSRYMSGNYEGTELKIYFFE